jgi:hypothetical protein
MNNLPFNTIGLSGDEIDRFSDTYKALKSKFNINFTGNIDFDLKQFEVFRNYFEVNLRDSYVIKHFDKESYMLFIQTHTRTLGQKGGVYDNYENQTWALAYLKRDFGRMLIKRETLVDKLIELVHPVELDFVEDKPFSDTFYVMVNDRHKAETAIDRNFRNAVMDTREDNFVIEIVEHTLLIGNQKPISPERAIYLAEFVARISTLC